MILHADLMVQSMDTALEFYCDKLGFSVVDESVVRGSIVQHVSHGCYEGLRLALLRVSPVGAMIELVEFKPESALTSSALPLRAGWITILIADLNAHINRMKRKGVDPTSEIFTVELPKSGACKVVFYKDPDGNDLEFLQVLKSYG